MVGSDTMVVVSSSRPTPPGSATTATAKEEREVPSKGIAAPTASMVELLARGGNSGGELHCSSTCVRVSVDYT